MPEHHKIIIQAAVEAILGARARVLRIAPAGSQVSPWTRQGRLAIQGSHSLPLRMVRFLPDPGAIRR
jgi:hypothetical protein